MIMIQMSDPDLPAKHLLVYANKQDLPSALSPAEVANKLGLNKLKNINVNINE